MNKKKFLIARKLTLDVNRNQEINASPAHSYKVICGRHAEVAKMLLEKGKTTTIRRIYIHSSSILDVKEIAAEFAKLLKIDVQKEWEDSNKRKIQDEDVVNLMSFKFNNSPEFIFTSHIPVISTTTPTIKTALFTDESTLKNWNLTQHQKMLAQCELIVIKITNKKTSTKCDRCCACGIYAFILACIVLTIFDFIMRFLRR